MKLSIRLTLVMIGVVATTTVGTLFFADQLLEKIIYERGMRQLETRARLLAATVEDKLGEASADLLIIPSTTAISRLMRGAAPAADGGPSDAERLVDFMKTRMSNNPSYLSFGVVTGDEGRQLLIGVERLGLEGALRAVENGTTAHRFDTDVYRRADAPKSGEVHFAPIRVGTSVDDPVWGAMPVLQISTPIIAPDGSLFGIAFINADARPLLDTVKSMFSAGEGSSGERIYIADAAGRYFVEPDQLRQMSNQLLPPSEMRPILAASGIRPHSQIVSDGGARDFAIATAGLNPARGTRLSAAVSIPYAEMMLPFGLMRKAILLAGLFAAGITIVLGVTLARSVVQPLAEMTTAIRTFDPERGLQISKSSLAAAGEIGVLANTFQEMAEQVKLATARLKLAGDERAQMKDEFVAMVSHELRTPLTSISASLGLLVADPSRTMSEAASRLLRIAHSNSQRLVRLINDILDVEKIETGKIEFEMKQLDVCRLIEQSIEGVRGYADQFDVIVTLDPKAERLFVRGDADRFMQVVTNLLSNAIKYSPSRGEVFVSVESMAELVRISIRDHGPGIPETFRAHIFEKFAQASAGDERQKGGTGLGLSIARQIVLKFGGEVGFYDAPDGGTVFHVDLPRDQGSEESAETTRAHVTPAQGSTAPEQQTLYKPNKEVA